MDRADSQEDRVSMNRERYGALATGIVAVGILIAGIGGGATTAQMHMATPGGSPIAEGHDHGHGDAHGDPVNMSTGAAYMTIVNEGDEADVLLSARTDAAGVVEIHEVQVTDGVMSMRPVEGGLEIPAGEIVVLEQGGGHMMLIGLTTSLIPGESYRMTLTFERAGDVEITIPILPIEPEGEDDEGYGDPVEAGELTIEKAWSRQAPRIGSGMGTPMASPMATPES